MPELSLAGCRLEPLGSYLKALGVFRVVAEQADPSARGRWTGESFTLDTSLAADGLIDFLCTRYRPTPLLAPWNKGTGFGADDAAKSPKATAAVKVVVDSIDPRLANFRNAITVAEQLRQRAGWYELGKEDQVALCRNAFPDEAVAWLDATVVLTADDRVFPPLLGTGGNDGRFDFGSNFMQRIADLFGLVKRSAKSATAREAAQAAVFATGSPRLDQAAIGQFDPAGAGGPASSPFGSAESLSNPWDFVLLLEGALMFAASTARRLSSQGNRAAVPFIVNASPAGHPTATSENSRGEMWAPVWSAPASFGEVTRLISEGRADYHGRQARNAVDVARALTSLGVDRGVDGFVRHAFLERNGLATQAVSIGRFAVAERPAMAAVGRLDRFLNRVRGIRNAPASIEALLREADDAQFAIAAAGTARTGAAATQRLLIAASRLEHRVSLSREMRSKVPPIDHTSIRDRLIAAEWIPALNDGTVEHRVAVALASFHRRENGTSLLRPLFLDMDWQGRPPSVDGLGQRPLPDVLADALVTLTNRRWSTPTEALPESTRLFYRTTAIGVGEADLAKFVVGDVDDRRIASLLRAYVTLDWWDRFDRSSPDELPEQVPPAIALLAPAFHLAAPRLNDAPVLYAARPSWPAMLRTSDPTVVGRCLGEAIQRLELAGVEPRVRSSAALTSGLSGTAPGLDAIRRVAAACLIPVTHRATNRMFRRIAAPKPTPEVTTTEDTP